MLAKSLTNGILGLAAALLVAGCTTPPPAETHDGLVLQPDMKADSVYVRPGVSLAGYSEYGLQSCDVAFRKNWMRDQNTSRLDLSDQVTQKDVDRIREALSAECDKFFREALLEDPAYNIVDSFDEGERVLVLHPSIINLDVTAPDLRSPGMQRTYTANAGEMTLFLELYDGTTGEILVRVQDRQQARDNMRIQYTNSITNRFEADRILKEWGSRLRRGLDTAVEAN